jgi:hypothetical protein
VGDHLDTFWDVNLTGVEESVVAPLP